MLTFETENCLKVNNMSISVYVWISRSTFFLIKIKDY